MDLPDTSDKTIVSIDRLTQLLKIEWQIERVCVWAVLYQILQTLKQTIIDKWWKTANKHTM